MKRRSAAGTLAAPRQASIPARIVGQIVRFLFNPSVLEKLLDEFSFEDVFRGFFLDRLFGRLIRRAAR